MTTPDLPRCVIQNIAQVRYCRSKFPQGLSVNLTGGVLENFMKWIVDNLGAEVLWPLAARQGP